MEKAELEPESEPENEPARSTVEVVISMLQGIFDAEQSKWWDFESSALNVDPEKIQLDLERCMHAVDVTRAATDGGQVQAAEDIICRVFTTKGMVNLEALCATYYLLRKITLHEDIDSAFGPVFSTVVRSLLPSENVVLLLPYTSEARQLYSQLAGKAGPHGLESAVQMLAFLESAELQHMFHTYTDRYGCEPCDHVRDNPAIIGSARYFVLQLMQGRRRHGIRTSNKVSDQSPCSEHEFPSTEGS